MHDRAVPVQHVNLHLLACSDRPCAHATHTPEKISRDRNPRADSASQSVQHFVPARPVAMMIIVYIALIFASADASNGENDFIPHDQKYRYTRMRCK